MVLQFFAISLSRAGRAAGCFGLLGMYSVFRAFERKLSVFTALSALPGLVGQLNDKRWERKTQSANHKLFPDMCVAKAPLFF